MKERGSGKPHARSSVSGSVIKMKVKKTSEDKQVQMYTVTLVESVALLILQRDINRKQLLNFLNST